MSEILESVGLKTCSRCKQTLPVSEFGKKKSRKDGLQSSCKNCTREMANQWYDENREHYNEQRRQWYDENKGHLNELQRQSRQDPEVKRKYQVRDITNKAIARGELIRPDECPQCGANDSVIDAHHLSYDYGDELNVMWLCHKCHGALHRRNRID